MIDSCPFGCSWEEGQRVCKENNATLPEPEFSIAEDEGGNEGRDELNEYEFLTKLADQNQPFSNWWIGITDVESEGVVQEGIKQVKVNKHWKRYG